MTSSELPLWIISSSSLSNSCLHIGQFNFSWLALNIFFTQVPQTKCPHGVTVLVILSNSSKHIGHDSVSFNFSFNELKILNFDVFNLINSSNSDFLS